MKEPDEDLQSENNNDTGGGSEIKSGSSASHEKGTKLNCNGFNLFGHLFITFDCVIFFPQTLSDFDTVDLNDFCSLIY